MVPDRSSVRSSKQRIPCAARGTLAALFALALTAVLGGCGFFGSGTQGRGDALLQGEVDPDRLRMDVRQFVEDTRAALNGFASESASKARDRALRELLLRTRLRVQISLDDILLERDARLQFLEVWVLAARMRFYFSKDEERRGFGDAADGLLRLAQDLEEKVQAVGRRHFSEEQIALAKEDVARLIENAPIKNVGLGTDQASWVSTLGSSVGSNASRLLSMPLAPFTGLQGVADTASAVSRFTVVAEDFSRLLAQLPERLRWESGLLALDIQSTDGFTELERRLDEVTASFRAIVQSSNDLPGKLGEEGRSLVASVDAAQPGLRATAGEFREAAAVFREALVTADKVALNIREASVDLGRAGAAWECTADSVSGVLEGIDKLGGPPDPTRKPVEISDLVELAASVNEAVSSARALIEELKAPVVGRSIVGSAAADAEGVVRVAAAYAAGLVGLVFVAALAFHGLTRGSRRRRESGDSGPGAPGSGPSGSGPSGSGPSGSGPSGSGPTGSGPTGAGGAKR